MFLFVKTAWLNIFKHGKRSAVVFLTVAVSVTIMILVNAVMNGITGNLVENILPSSGHLTVKNADAGKAANPLDPKYLLADADGLSAALDDPRVIRREKVLSFGAIVMENRDPEDTTRDVRNLALSGTGILPDSIYFDNIRKSVVEGTFIVTDEDLLLSASIAGLLSLRTGDRVTVLTSDANGNPWYREFNLSGLYSSGSDQTDENFFFVTHKAAEQLLDTEGMTREIRLSIADADRSAEVRDALASVLAGRGAVAETWQETFGSLLAILGFFDIINIFVNTYFTIVAASVIVNAIVMSVFERIREFGTLRAVGLKRRGLFAMILSEGAILGLSGAALGTLSGLGLVLFFRRYGIDAGSATEYLGFKNLLYPALNPPGIAFAAACGVAITMLASLYAARVSSRLSITESLAHL